MEAWNNLLANGCKFYKISILSEDKLIEAGPYFRISTNKKEVMREIEERVDNTFKVSLMGEIKVVELNEVPPLKLICDYHKEQIKIMLDKHICRCTFCQNKQPCIKGKELYEKLKLYR